MGRHEHTLCWDCANCVGGCSWSSKGQPVEGWRARPTKIRFSGETTDSFIVYHCPKFERDAENGGMKKAALGREEDHYGKNLCRDKSCASAPVGGVVERPDSGDLGHSRGAVANRKNRRTRVLTDGREMIDLGFGLLERAVIDWKTLEYGRKESALVEKCEWVEKDELVRFFFSRFFALLCEPLPYSPEEIRSALKIPEEARWTIK